MGAVDLLQDTAATAPGAICKQLLQFCKHLSALLVQTHASTSNPAELRARSNLPPYLLSVAAHC